MQTQEKGECCNPAENMVYCKKQAADAVLIKRRMDYGFF